MAADYKNLEKLKDEFVDACKKEFDRHQFNLLAITCHSTAIEGSTLDTDEVYNLIKYGIAAEKPLEHNNMVYDHYNAICYILGLAESKTLINQQLLQKIAGFVMRTTGGMVHALGGDFDTSKGDLRLDSRRAGTTLFMDYTKIPRELGKLVNDLRTDLQKSQDFISANRLAFDVHFRLVTIHPFGDGNGRTSRLLMNYVQHWHGFPLSMVWSEDKIKYVKALRDSRDKSDVGIFHEFMFGQMEKYFIHELKDMQRTPNKKKDKTSGFTYLF
ncbi:MAG: Fic family protein [Flavobacteriaceae bacterium]|nr:Fic family protein [Flavobacteriaceae bacterium]